MSGETENSQADVIAFLADPRSWGEAETPIAHIQTHGAHVFLGPDRALKIKRAVRYDYMDFSTLERRRAVVDHEVALNRRFAPTLYLGAVALTREADGRIAIGGAGEPIEWAVAMRRFADDALLSAVARWRPLASGLVKALAATVIAAHRAAPVDDRRDVLAASRALIAPITRSIRALGDGAMRDRATRLAWLATAALDRAAPVIAARRRAGSVRRCHGDLHLANIVLIDGRPTLFDALEFDDALTTIDTLYDFAFLLMDLDARGHRPEANLLVAHYLWLSGEAIDLEGLAALPLYLALRAAIRAMVGMQRGAAMPSVTAAGGDPTPADYLDRALGYLAPPAPRLVAVGGLSGTGKSTLAAALAPRFGAAPGALHLRSDLERKWLAGVGETDRLPASAYGPGSSDAVYDRLVTRARLALAAGHSVIVDAVFQREAERRAVEQSAQSLGVRFDGVWLTAPVATMVERIRARSSDASDATPDVALAQLARDQGAAAWPIIDAGAAPEVTLAAACNRLCLDQSRSST